MPMPPPMFTKSNVMPTFRERSTTRSKRSVAVSMMYWGSSSFEATIVWRPNRRTPFAFICA